MLSMDFIKANRVTVERAIRDKGVELDLRQLLTLDAGVRAPGIAAYSEGLAEALGDGVDVVRPPGGLLSRTVWRERHRA